MAVLPRGAQELPYGIASAGLFVGLACDRREDRGEASQDILRARLLIGPASRSALTRHVRDAQCEEKDPCLRGKQFLHWCLPGAKARAFNP